MSCFNMNFLLLAEETAQAVTTPPGRSPWGILLTLVAICVIPFVLGNLIAQMLKLKEFGTRIGVVLFTLVLGLTPFVNQMIHDRSPLDAISLGIDLAGGTNMIFQVDKQAAEASGKPVTNELMDKMVQAVTRRVNPTGTEEVSVRKVGNDRLEVIVPGADKEKVAQTIRQIVDLGKLEFALLANETAHADIIRLADSLGDSVYEVYDKKDGKDVLVAKWRHAAIGPNGEPEVQPGDRVHFRTKTVGDKQELEYLVIIDPDPKRRIDGELLKSVRETVTDRGLAVGFTFNDYGGHLMEQLTSKYKPQEGLGYKYRLAVLLNEEIHSAPTINAVIGSTGVIEGNFSQEDIDSLVSVLNAGALQVPLIRKPVSESTISPLLGTDVKEKGLRAMGWALLAVFLITGIYYLVPGIIADVCLVLNLILVMGAMAMIHATFTLPGLAGLVLSIGMAVDANVLIFERMREELQRGSSTRMAIKNGFDKAWMTIFDSNVTTLITAVILYYIGTDQVKGFAVTLFIGILISMFTAVYVGRLIFEIGERKRWLPELKMMSLIKAGNYDFLGKRGTILAAAFVLLGLGLLVVAARGKENLDIDFRGGSLVSFKFVGDAPQADEVRKALETHFEKSLSLERHELADKQVLFQIRTIEPDAHKVAEKIKDAFAGTPFKLEEQQVSVGELKEIPKATLAEGATPTASESLFGGGREAQITLERAMQPASLAEEAIDHLKTSLGIQSKEPLVEAVAVDPAVDGSREITLKFANTLTPEQVQSTLTAVEHKLEAEPHFEEVNTFDSSVAGDTQKAALLAIFLSLVAIVAYLWLRFQRVTFGLAACVALLYDVFLVLGLMAIGAYLSGNTLGQLLMLDDFKINLTVVAAFLTIIGYSLNDKIVVFDRIREVRGRNPALTEQMVNQSLNETLSRTLLTSMTTLAVLAILYVLGGEGIHTFCYCLTLGIIIGTFSSIFIACPVLLWLSRRENKSVAAT
ncbi:protein translocase subunit SecD [Planctomicrobium sp. SH664]|uniref:protein translocase subunit SecD n=1 Tax=Planctomicrobium sp. SH664 TaxID=3448125 RepID=UPI003F5B87EE